MAIAGRLVVVTGAARGLGVGICRQALKRDTSCEVVLLARDLAKAEAVAAELGERTHCLTCDVSSAESCSAVAVEISSLRRGRPLSLVNNAGVGLDLPWFPTPWPPEVAAQTLSVNLFGVRCITEALLPLLTDEDCQGRVVFVSSGGGAMNMKRMSDARRDFLMAQSTTWGDIETLASEFQAEYENAAAAQAQGIEMPLLSESGNWLQSYGFSKACLNAYCRILANAHPNISSVACSPGFVGTDMVKTYTGDMQLKTVDEGGDVVAWLACGDGAETGRIYGPDKAEAQWIAS